MTDSQARDKQKVARDFGENDTPVMVQPHQVMKYPGLPKLIEYHMMNNKRFVLTQDEQKHVQLWKLDELSLAREFPG